MSSRQFETAPTSEAVTRHIRVEVWPSYSAENSRPGQWVFQYGVRITNLGLETVQLVSRHWYISDAFEQVHEVEGPGVIGEQPVLEPGASFQYSSWCPLPTATGSMRGTYRMLRTSGDHFDVEIAEFTLAAPYTVH